ncbi:MAG TPA: hypothetical protein VF868_11905 [Bacteroidia bacterium]
MKKNSAEFKAVRELVNDYQDNKNRKKFIRMYSLKPAEPLENKILLGKPATGGEMLYDINYDTVVFNLLDAKHKLFRDESSGIYYFKPSSKSNFKESPFDFTGKLKKELKAVIKD